MSVSDGGEETSRAVLLIEGGAELAGAAVGGATGFVVGGPGGAALGGAGGVAVTRAIKRLGDEITRRRLGPQEQVRIGAAAAYAYASINVRLMAGNKLRDDEPWREDAGRGRSAAEEVLEGVLRAAADSWEQRKVKHVGLLFASLAFRPDIGPAYANVLVRIATSIGYGQLQLLRFIDAHAGDERLSTIDAKRAVAGPSVLPGGLSYELVALRDAALVGVADGSGIVRLAAATGPGIFENQLLGTMQLTMMGKDLHDLMRLDTISEEAIEELWVPLQSSAAERSEQT